MKTAAKARAAVQSADKHYQSRRETVVLMLIGVVVTVIALAGCASPAVRDAGGNVVADGDIGCRTYVGGTARAPLTLKIAPPGGTIPGHAQTPIEEEYSADFFTMIIEDPARQARVEEVLLEPHGRTLMTVNPQKIGSWYMGRHTIMPSFSVTRTSPHKLRVAQAYIGVQDIDQSILVYREKWRGDFDYSGTYVCAE